MTYVYILTNEAMPGLVKIGRTSTSVEQRMSELNRHAGIPLPFVCYYAAEVADSAKVEKKLHEAFGDHRIRAQREFFRLSPHRAQAALELAAISDATPKDEIVDEFPEDAQQGLTRENARKSLPTFGEYKIPLGAKLLFTKDNNITAVVNGDRTLEFRGQTLSMSAAALLALKGMGYNWKSANGSAYWEIDGETVWDRWERIHGQNP